MNYSKSFATIIITALSLCSNTLFCIADDVVWYQDKEEVFRLAKEQDKYIFLLSGRPTCGNCNRTFGYINNDDEPLKQIANDDYILWYSFYDNPARKAETMIYIAEPLKTATALPILCIINPDDPDKNVAATSGYKTVDALKNLMTIDLIFNKGLTWYEDKEEAFRLAKEEKKYVFKLIGRGTSNNCQKMIQQLQNEPLKNILEKNYILWYSSDVSEIELETYSGDSEDITKVPPYIFVVDPSEPEISLASTWGYQDIETLEEMIKPYTVSNENINLQESKVCFSGNTLHISNNIDNEQINIYTITGQHVSSIHKKEQDVTIDTFYFPKGVLVIHSSKGWSAKIIKQ
ncbi:MAG: hypothetical protein LBV74_10185 [Tannerella sp.]|jgi:thioredoxin-related protein|nr:hypothetical protein [Tannerella sp.]